MTSGLEPRPRPLLAAANALARNAGPPSVTRLRADDRRMTRALGPLVLGRGAAVADLSDRWIPVRGGQIRVRLYQPAAGGIRPLLVFFHGGGYCLGEVETRDNRCRDLAAGVDCLVASVDYRLAPENAYPTAVEDGYAALSWLVDHADELGIDPDRVAVGGESAGANLATVAALMARDRGGPVLVFQVLDVPWTDLTLSQPSVHELGTGYLLTRAELELFAGQYLGDPRKAGEGYASPLLAADLSGLPPALVTTAEFDPLRDEGAAYARRLTEAGVPVQRQHLTGHIHESFAFTRLLPSAREHHRVCVTALSGAFRKGVG